MLVKIAIKNFALIRELELDLSDGLTVLTGETGSGKSIILGALGLVLGERADIKTLSLSDSKCIVEATFTLEDDETTFFEEKNLDYSKEVILRREITTGGKSRAFINDTPVSLATLKELGGRLVDIHSQHQNSILHEQSFQFAILDSFAGLQDVVSDYKKDFFQYRTLVQRLVDLKNADKQAKLDQDYFAFQLEEMSGIDFENIDFESMEQEMETLNNAEEIKSVLGTLAQGIEWSDQSLISSLNELISEVGNIADYHSGIKEIEERLKSVHIELKDIRSEGESIDNGVLLDSERTERLAELLDNIYRLQQKHRLKTVEELRLKKNELEDKVHQGLVLDSQIEKTEKELENQEEKLREQCEVISKKREKSGPKLKSAIEEVFAQLGLEKAVINLVLSSLDSFSEYGKERISFDFSANPGSPIQPIERVASGGEISRVMLALKAVFSKHTNMPTLILDEIDNGVSGEIGKRLGSVMKAMSKDSQLITITHLPQIAGKGDHHMKVYKRMDKDLTTTYIKQLDESQRINELAEMLSGKQMTDAAKENAKELLQS